MTGGEQPGVHRSSIVGRVTIMGWTIRESWFHCGVRRRISPLSNSKVTRELFHGDKVAKE
jgi:hypothetical protein